MSKEIDELISFVEEHCNRLTGFYGHYGVDNSAYNSQIKKALNNLITENIKLKKDNELLKTALSEMVDISSRINILQSDSI